MTVNIGQKTVETEARIRLGGEGGGRREEGGHAAARARRLLGEGPASDSHGGSAMQQVHGSATDGLIPRDERHAVGCPPGSRHRPASHAATTTTGLCVTIGVAVGV